MDGVRLAHALSEPYVEVVRWLALSFLSSRSWSCGCSCRWATCSGSGRRLECRGHGVSRRLSREAGGAARARELASRARRDASTRRRRDVRALGPRRSGAASLARRAHGLRRHCLARAAGAPRRGATGRAAPVGYFSAQSGAFRVHVATPSYGGRARVVEVEGQLVDER